MLPNGADFLCIQILLIFPSVPPAVIGHLAKGPDPGFFFCMCMLWPANLCIATAVWDGKNKIVPGWQAGNLSALCFHFYLQTEPTSYWEASNWTPLLFQSKGQVKDFAFFFASSYKKALNMNLILCKALGQVVLDLKSKSKPACHLVLLLMEVKV